jgi:hypothetical protein
MPASIRHNLEKQLEESKRDTLIPKQFGIKEFFASFPEAPPERFTFTNKIDNFPSLPGDTYIPLNNTVTTEEYIKWDHDNKNTIFVNNKLVIPFNDLVDVHKSMAFGRIKHFYLSVNYKIRVLHLIRDTNNVLWKHLYQTFNYNDLLNNEKKYFKIITLLTHLHNMLKITQTSQLLDELTIVEKIIGKIPDVYDMIVSKDNIKWLRVITCVIDDVCSQNDPHTKCAYHVSIKNVDGKTVHVKGIAHNIYLPVNNFPGTSVRKVAMSKKELRHITEPQLSYIFNRQCILDSSQSHYYMCFGKTNGRMYTVHFDIDDELPDNITSLKVLGMPHDYKLFTTFYRIPKSNKKYIIPIVRPPPRCEMITISESSYLEPHVLDTISRKEQYLHDGYCSTSLIADSIYDEICQQYPDMFDEGWRESFKQLCYDTSL